MIYAKDYKYQRVPPAKDQKKCPAAANPIHSSAPVLRDVNVLPLVTLVAARRNPLPVLARVVVTVPPREPRVPARRMPALAHLAAIALQMEPSLVFVVRVISLLGVLALRLDLLVPARNLKTLATVLKAVNARTKVPLPASAPLQLIDVPVRLVATARTKEQNPANATKMRYQHSIE